MTSTPTFRALAGLYEPSAIQQLPDGRFLAVEDEKRYPFSLLDIDAEGRARSAPLEPGFFEAFDAFWKLDDLEGLALDPAGWVYAVTSHSRDGDGDEKKSRDKLVRFRIEADRVVDQGLSRALKPALRTAHPVLDRAAALRDVKADGGFNIEALEYFGGRLWVGFRSPLLDGRAILAAVENPEALFEAGEAPRIASALTTLDLEGDGIRGLAHVPALGGHLVIGGPAARAAVQFRLWFWDGGADARCRRVTVPGLDGFEHAEGVCPARIDGRDVIVLVSDDGDRKAGRPARFLVLEPAQLRIAD